jgi:O-antigen/teichoic acid export membrane protein
VGAALFPSLVHLMETEGLARAVRWQDLATRMGLLLIGLGLGLFLLIGDVLVPMVFGQEYRTATPVLAIAFWSVVPLWIGGQHLRLALLLNRTAAYPLSAAALLAGFALCFWLLPPDPAGVNTAWSLLAGNALFALVLVAFLRRHVPGLIGQLRPLLLPLLLAGFGWPLSRVAGAWQTAAVIAAWTALYAGAAFLSGSIRRHEMAEIVSAVWTPRRQSVEM